MVLVERNWTACSSEALMVVENLLKCVEAVVEILPMGAVADMLLMVVAVENLHTVVVQNLQNAVVGDTQKNKN